MNKKAQNLKSQMTQISGQMQLIRAALKADGWEDIRKIHKLARLKAFKYGDELLTIFVTCHSSFDWQVTTIQHAIGIKGPYHFCSKKGCDRIQKIVNDALAQRGSSR